MRNAVAPITGGANWPPFDAMASTAAAKYPGKPVFFISGMLTTPVDITFPTVEPLIEPKIELATMETFAGPPL